MKEKMSEKGGNARNIMSKERVQKERGREREKRRWLLGKYLALTKKTDEKK